jgi:hypothetical protein
MAVDIRKYEDLSRKIIGCAYRVYNKMGFGFLESAYEKCLLMAKMINRILFILFTPLDSVLSVGCIIE